MMFLKKIHLSFSTHPLSTPQANVHLLRQFGIINPNIYRNLTVPQYYQKGMNFIPFDFYTKPNALTDTGAFVAYSGKNTGGVQKSISFVNDPIRQREIEWGQTNKRMPAHSFQILQDLAVNYFNTRSKLYVVDGYVGWDYDYRIKIRVVCTRAYHALFMHNMLVRPTLKQLQEDFSQGTDYYIFNAGEFNANKYIPGVIQNQATALNLQQRKMVILGSQYAGQMKKGVFTIMNYLMPKNGHLSLNSSCNIGKNGDVALFFGLSGAGKTTLSIVQDRKLIGDSQHVWTQEGIFNIEGGCYAKCLNLSKQKEPEIYDAIKFGTILENVTLKKSTREVNFFYTQFSENTRASYPLQYIRNSQIPAVTTHPKNIIFLTCDAFSVFPPVSKLTTAQALYHFYSGYTTKIVQTKQGIKQPLPMFSACFGQQFLPFKPQVYADLLADKIKNHQTNVWLVNTGWSGGKYGNGKRISLKDTRSIINAIHDGKLQSAQMSNFPIFNLTYPTNIDGLNSKILNPAANWKSHQQFQQALEKVADMFRQNFRRFQKDASDFVKSGGPTLI